MLTRIEELEIRVGELVKEKHELREAGERLAKENKDKHFALKKQAECNYKLMKEIEALQKEVKELKENKLEKNKWYRASDFYVDELREKLGTGVLVEVVKHSNEDKDEMRPELKESKFERVQYIAKDGFGKTALSTGSVFYRNWFRVI